MTKNKTKVCHMTSAHKRNDIRIFHKECRSLVEDGYDVTLLVNDEFDNEESHGVKIVSINKKYINRLSRIARAKQDMCNEALKIDSDVYHIHDPELLPTAKSLIDKGKIVFYDAHEDVPRQILAKEWIPLSLRKIVSVIYERYENKISSRMTAIIVPTPHIKDRFLKQNKNTIMVRNFPLLREFTTINHKKTDVFSCCYIGAISRNRGIENIAQATHNLSSKLTLCGEFDSEELKNKVVNGYSNIQYKGYLNRNEIGQVLGDSSIGLVVLLPTPNHLNSYPIKMFEYMAAGIPIIASNFGLWKEILNECNCGIAVDPNSIDEIQRAIEYLKNNPSISYSMGMNGHKAIIDKYNWTIEEKKLKELYSKY